MLYNDRKRKTISKVSATTELLYSGVRDILVKEMNLNLYLSYFLYDLYKARASQKLNARLIDNRLAFCERVKNMIEVLNLI